MMTKEDFEEPLPIDEREVLGVANPAIFKAKDIASLDNVVSLLGKYNLTPLLDGSVVDSAWKGNPGNYRDINLFIRADPETESQRDCAVEELRQISERTGKLGNLEVEYFGQIHTHDDIRVKVHSRFKIRNKATGTIIRLAFEEYNQPASDFEKLLFKEECRARHEVDKDFGYGRMDIVKEVPRS